MKKPGYQKVNVVKRGVATYLKWIGWCSECDKMRTHTEPMYVSMMSATCSKGHYSSGGPSPKKEFIKKI